MKRWLYYATAFVTGACVMALEMIGFRLFAPYFGYSIYVTGSLISVVLLAMSLGYLFGGWLADRSRNDTPLFLSLWGASFCFVLIFWGSPLVLGWLQSWGFISGTLWGALILLMLPMFLLAAAPPYLIQLLAHENKVGWTAGQIVALSTLGSIAGTLLASFWWIPSLGIRWSLFTCFVITQGLALLGLLRHSRMWGAGLVGMGLFWVTTEPRSPVWNPQYFQLLWDTESLYSRLIVMRNHYKKTVFVMPTHHFIHSEKPIHQRFSQSEQDVYSVGGWLAGSPQQILLLGLGSGTTFQQLRYFFPQATITGVDIDPTMIEIGRKFFGFQPDAQTRVIVADARYALQQSSETYDLIAINVTAGSIFLPFHLATQEAFEQMARRLSSKGWVLLNLVDPEPERHLTRCVMKTMKSVFSQIFWVPFDGNAVVFATQQPVRGKEWEVQSLQPRFKELRPLIQRVLRTKRAWQDSAWCQIWTDDRSGLEAMTLRSLLQIQKRP